MKVENWNTDNQAEALRFLQDRYASSMYLIGNFTEHGPRLTDHPNSGNMKLIKSAGKLLAVFSLTRRGNLIVSGEIHDGVCAALATSASGENLKIHGVIGEYQFSSALWNHMLNEKILSSSSFASKEVLYKIDVCDVRKIDERIPDIRFLGGNDFQQWREMRRAFNREVGLVHDLNDEEISSIFRRYSGRNEYWGYFVGERLVATAALNAKALGVGQIGGVYTIPELRRQGYSQRLMRRVLGDFVSVHGLTKAILFTGETNLRAQNLYEGLGFARTGAFGIFFI